MGLSRGEKKRGLLTPEMNSNSSQGKSTSAGISNRAKFVMR